MTRWLIIAILVVSGCATEVDLGSDEPDTVDSVCTDINDLAREMQDDGDILSTRWIDEIDSLGIRAAGLDTFRGDQIMEGLAEWSVGLEQADPDLAVEGLEKIEEVCS
jgi:hypothetical protein